MSEIINQTMQESDLRPSPRVVTSEHRLDDRLFRAGTRAVGLGVFILLFAIGGFLLYKAMPALQKNGFLSFLTTSSFTTDGVAHPSFGVAALLYWTVVLAVIAGFVGVPLAIGTALFITEFAPRRLRRILVTVIDLLAVVPSIIFGLWGLLAVEPHMEGFAKFLSVHASFIPIFRVTTPNAPPSLLGPTAFVAGVVLGIMIVPIVTSITREIFSLAPQGEREAALALGASKASMIRAVVLPFGRGGMIGAVMLGLGRAMGETIAVAIIVAGSLTIEPHILQVGGNSIAAFIVQRFGTGGSLGLSALLGAGFILFCFTLLVNLAASVIVNRSRTGASA